MDTLWKHLPNILSISRVPASALFLVLFSTDDALRFWLATLVAFLALITDFADGYYARKWGLVTETGYFLDGLGDKCFTISFCLVIAREIPDTLLLTWALIARELLLYGLRAVDPLKTKNLGRFRSISLWQAGSIRVLFGVFLSLSAFEVHGLNRPEVVVYLIYAAAFSATVFGWTSVGLLTRQLLHK